MTDPPDSSWIVFMQSLQPVAPAITWLVVIAGWFFVRRDNNKREDRKELRSKLDSVIKDIKALEGTAYAYYMKDGDDPDIPQLIAEIRRDKRILERHLNFIKDTNRRFNSLDAKGFEFFHALTAGDFESPSRKKIEHSHQRFLEISTAAQNLIMELESEYDKQTRSSLIKKLRE